MSLNIVILIICHLSDTDVEDEEQSGDEDDTADMISNDSGNEGDSEYNPSDADGDSAADTKVNEYRIIKLVFFLSRSAYISIHFLAKIIP